MLPKLLGRLVAGQLMDYMSTASLHPAIQSGLRPGYLTETAVLRVLSDILLAVDRGDLTALISSIQVASLHNSPPALFISLIT